MRKKVYCQLPEFIVVPKRKPGKVREYMYTFYFRGTDSEGSDYMEKTFSYFKPVIYSRVYGDFLEWIKKSVYMPCDYVVVERIEYDVIYHRQSEVLFSTSCFNAEKYCPF